MANDSCTKGKTQSAKPTKMEEFFFSIAGDDKEIDWQELQKVLSSFFAGCKIFKFPEMYS